MTIIYYAFRKHSKIIIIDDILINHYNNIYNRKHVIINT